MFAGIINGIGVIIGGLIGALIGKKLPAGGGKMGESVLLGMGLCVLVIGITGSIQGEAALIPILAIALGTVLGELLDLDGKLHRLGEKAEKKFSKGGNGGKKGRFAEGFVTASLLFCVGAMAVVGSISAGMTGDYGTILSKTVIDTVTAVIFGTQFGVGVCFSAIPICLYQGGIALLAKAIAPFLTNYPGVITEINCCGSILIIGIALNMLFDRKIRVMNMLPAILFAGLFAFGYYAWIV